MQRNSSSWPGMSGGLGASSGSISMSSVCFLVK